MDRESFTRRELIGRVAKRPVVCCPTVIRGHNERGPYVSAPYLSVAKTFAPFAVIQKSHGIHTELFSRLKLYAPTCWRLQLEAVDRILLPKDTPLTRVQKECILLAVSAANLNSECVAIHCNMLRGLGMPSEDGDQIAVDHHESELPDPDKALLDFAVKLGNAWFGHFP